MRRSRPISTEAAAHEIVPSNYFQLLDLNTVFQRQAPLEIDLGCGDGAFLVALARDNPERNFLGIERLVGRVGTACRAIARHQLNNARIMRLEASYAVRYVVPSRSVETFHLMFPDPWPKRRHQTRRIVTPELLESIHRALVSGGLLQMATDQLDYLHEFERLADGLPGFRPDSTHPPAAALTTFEKRFRDCGARIYRVVLRKSSEVT
jgi:tRNA (guanine-N7-)-methyltransferase